MDMFLAPLPMVYAFLSLFVLQVCFNIDDFNIRNLFLTAKLLKQGYRYHKTRKTFSKFYHRHTELIVKYNIRLKTLLQQDNNNVMTTRYITLWREKYRIDDIRVNNSKFH